MLSTQQLAATKLARFLKANTFEALLEKTLREEYTRLKDLDFPALVHKLRSPSLCKPHARFVRKMLKTIIDCPELESFNPRIILAAFMIVLHPARSFEAGVTPGSLEEAVFRSGTAMLQAFDAICKAAPSARTELILTFKEPLLSYTQDFKAWKIPDENRVISRLERALLAIYEAKRQRGDANDEATIAIDAQIEKLRFIMARMSQARLDRFDAMRRSMAPPQ
jgi:hypothetical protein